MSNSLENWKPVRGYEGLYEVSSFGRVRSLDREVTQLSHVGKMFKRPYHGVMMKSNVNRVGYPYVNLSKDGIRKTFKIHRLVAIAFIPNPNDKNEVNHIDGVKTNNITTNLEWVTSSENKKHAFNTGLKCNPRGKNARNFRGTVLVIDPHGNSIDELNGHADIKSKGYTSCGVSAVLTGLQKTHRNCTFKIKDSEKTDNG